VHPVKHLSLQPTCRAGLIRFTHLTARAPVMPGVTTRTGYPWSCGSSLHQSAISQGSSRVSRVKAQQSGAMHNRSKHCSQRAPLYMQGACCDGWPCEHLGAAGNLVQKPHWPFIS
jgi:hypothetical protein